MIEVELHKKLGSITNNRSWNLIESVDLTEAEAEELLATAMASVYHWAQFGDPDRFPARDLLAAAALLRLGAPVLARPFVERTFTVLSEPERADWERAFAYAVQAWYDILIGENDAATKAYNQAREIGEGMPDPEDRMIFFATFDVIPVPA